MSTGRWPELPAAWADTYATLHMWSQIVGKIALAQAPRLNHSWSAALQLTSRGLMTPLAAVSMVDRKRTTRLSVLRCPAQFPQLTCDLVSVPDLVTLRPGILPRIQRQISEKRTVSSKTTCSATQAYIPSLPRFSSEECGFSAPIGHFFRAKRTTRNSLGCLTWRKVPFFSYRATCGSLSGFDALRCCA